MRKELQRPSLTFSDLGMPEALNWKMIFLHVNPGKQHKKGKMTMTMMMHKVTHKQMQPSFLHVRIGTVLADNLQPGLPKYLVAGLLNEG